MSATNDVQAPPRCPYMSGVAFDPLLPEQAGEPYPWLAVAREECPVFFWPQHNVWCVTRYQDINLILRDTTTFSNRKTISFDNMSEEFALAFPNERPDRVLVTLDPPEHNRLRRLAQAAFSKSLVESKRAEVRGLCHQLIDAFADKGSADLVRDFADRLPVQVITRLVGAPIERTAFFRQCALDRVSMLTGAPDFSRQERAALLERALAFNEWMHAFIEERRDHPRDDLASTLVHATTKEGDPALTTPEILGLIATILSAGSTSTGHLITMMLLELLSHPDQWNELVADRSLVPAAIEETLRYRSPVQGVLRVTTREVDVGGVTIPEGADVYLYYASADRDPSAFADPDKFDIHRQDVGRHMGFGRLVHFCLGAPMARLEAEEALNAFLDRLPSMRLVEGREERWIPNLLSPGLQNLPVTW